MTSSPSWKLNHKTKDAAFTHILSCLIENPACADRDDGLIKVTLFGSLIAMKPAKKKQKTTNVNIDD